MDESTTPAAPVEDEIAIAIVVHSTADPIEGTIALPDERPVPFTGWMQLTQQLARVLDPPR